jgi:hypothetical protein
MCKKWCILKAVSSRGEVLKGLWGNPWERNIWLDIGIRGKGIIKWTFKKWTG